MRTVAAVLFAAIALLATEDVTKLAADAHEAFSNGKYEDAAVVYRSWAAAEPGSGPAQGGLVRSLLHAGKKPEAYAALAVAKRPHRTMLMSCWRPETSPFSKGISARRKRLTKPRCRERIPNPLPPGWAWCACFISRPLTKARNER